MIKETLKKPGLLTKGRIKCTLLAIAVQISSSLFLSDIFRLNLKFLHWNQKVQLWLYSTYYSAHMSSHV